jgi:DNA-binding response OmpR family regulator
MRALVVEDDRKVGQLIATSLEEWGYGVDVAYDGNVGLALALMKEYDVILLDIVLPQKTGIELVAELRREGRDTPVLCLTGQASVQDVARGLDAGADDYLTKPFHLVELQARVRALVRRGGAKRVDELTCGSLTLDRLKRLVLVAKTQVDLTPREFDLLEYLMLRPDVVVRRSELLEQVWGMSFHPGTRVVDVHMSNLRKKLAEAGGDDTIETVPRVGFRMPAQSFAD